MHFAGPWLGCLIKRFTPPRVRGCCVTWVGLRWLGTFAPWWMRSQDGGKRSDGCATTARLAGHHPAWLSWSAPIPGASDSCRVAVAEHAGGTSERDARSAQTRTITGSEFWQSKEKEASASTIANPAAAISRPTTGKEVRTCCWLTGLQYISILLPVIADSTGQPHRCTNFKLHDEVPRHRTPAVVGTRRLSFRCRSPKPHATTVVRQNFVKASFLPHGSFALRFRGSLPSRC